MEQRARRYHSTTDICAVFARERIGLCTALFARAYNGRSEMTALVQRDNSIARAITTVSASSQTAEKGIQSVTRIIFVKAVEH